MPQPKSMPEIGSLTSVRDVGRVVAVSGGLVKVQGLGTFARLGDQLRLLRKGALPLMGEVLQLGKDALTMLPEHALTGVSLGDRVILAGPAHIAPCDGWIGRVIDPMGRPLDGTPLPRGDGGRDFLSAPPPAAQRRGLGQRLETGMRVFNTLLPIVQGQRVGLFAGSGVGKTHLLGHLARYMQADVVVIALIGERGREVGDFVGKVLGPEGMARSVVVAATSDQSPLLRRRCAWTAMTVAEYFRDQGCNVLFLADSITRFAEAHREIAVASGEDAALRGYPASTAHTIMALAERAGPGAGSMGDVTALFTVLVPGSDMEEPVADILRGVLDGHVVLDRKIAERGRYPAIDLPRSVSRSLPDAATEAENALIGEARHLLGVYDENDMMIRAGLYAAGSDPTLDSAISIWPELDAFLAENESQASTNSFARLRLILRRASAPRPVQPGSASHATR
ncbi:FliI/YscN family ATPase [Lutimaribacter sp. EGI FJ00015]|uniref:FliI/YscN family ATPase n=1 Tax=Lutimaribacter degradans TaxID=2945989 RepID=A0ACC5ZU69_9RHOB|nr:FliI/YscN family ATPase [Lutimaribacter sp. EGI FJ00013]MCM2561893.1 FliI/YscN family ATPase [Lutimaribacter sp. EGI FJ00013]MCO0613075.1 FliI/YscN family ATPase [Lutimaribacter sp. EGI FJ00015]MCO0635725.1 FliI/YscN family ATPase [Lutimaribacter sp. EGI FJ00014]